MKAELKTKKTELNVSDFLKTIDDDTKRNDAKAIIEILKTITGDEPKLWGSSIIGFTDVHLKYDSGRELDWFRIGFSPRKQNITLYCLNGGSENFEDLLGKLGNHTTGKGCLYIKRLSEVNLEVLKSILKKSFELSHSTKL